MRGRFVLLLLLAGCPRDSAVAVADAAVAVVAAVEVPAVEDAGPGPPEESADVTLTLNRRERPMKWAIAQPGFQGVHLMIFSRPMDCAHVTVLDTMETKGATLELELLAGPGRTFYAGHSIGVNVIAKASDQKMEFPVDMGAMGAALGAFTTTLMMGPASVSLTVDPFEPKKGARIHGQLDGAEAMLIGSMAAKGTFDAELCDDASDVKGLEAAAPKTPVKAKTVHAMVRRRPASQDEAVDQSIKRSTGSYPEISQLVFHEKAKVPCPAPDKEQPGFMFLQSIGGTDQAHPQTTQQPATAVWRKGEDKFGDTSEAWVQLDSLAFENGAKVKGSLWTQREGQPAFTGRFEAVVCAP